MLPRPPRAHLAPPLAQTPWRPPAPPPPPPRPPRPSENGLTGTLPPQWGPAWADSIEELDLQTNWKLSGQLPDSWSKMRKLKDLRLL